MLTEMPIVAPIVAPIAPPSIPPAASATTPTECSTHYKDTKIAHVRLAACLSAFERSLDFRRRTMFCIVQIGKLAQNAQ